MKEISYKNTTYGICSASIKCPKQANPQRGPESTAPCQWLPGTGGREQGGTANGCGVSFRGTENVLKLDSADGCTTP